MAIFPASGSKSPQGSVAWSLEVGTESLEVFEKFRSKNSMGKIIKKRALLRIRHDIMMRTLKTGLVTKDIKVVSVVFVHISGKTLVNMGKNCEKKT